jgi:hypothetical protein
MTKANFEKAQHFNKEIQELEALHKCGWVNLRNAAAEMDSCKKSGDYPLTSATNTEWPQLFECIKNRITLLKDRFDKL